MFFGVKNFELIAAAVCSQKGMHLGDCGFSVESSFPGVETQVKLGALLAIRIVG